MVHATLGVHAPLRRAARHGFPRSHGPSKRSVNRNEVKMRLTSRSATSARSRHLADRVAVISSSGRPRSGKCRAASRCPTSSRCWGRTDHGDPRADMIRRRPGHLPASPRPRRGHWPPRPRPQSGHLPIGSRAWPDHLLGRSRSRSGHLLARPPGRPGHLLARARPRPGHLSARPRTRPGQVLALPRPRCRALRRCEGGRGAPKVQKAPGREPATVVAGQSSWPPFWRRCRAVRRTMS